MSSVRVQVVFVRVLRDLLAAAVLLTVAVFSEGQQSSSPSSAIAATSSRPRNADPNVQFVGSDKCKLCHFAIYGTFSRTEMGRATSLPEKAIESGWLSSPVEFFNSHTNRHYKVFARGSKVFETEAELDANGKEVFTHTEELAYVVGTGANGATPIVRRDNYLFQAPISYYTARKTWDLSPNYERQDLGFTLPVSAECIGCHAGRTQPVKGREGLFQDPPVAELGISCERCHGPGELHVKERTAGLPVQGGADSSIVNPKKLPTWLADNICMNCHEGDNRTLQSGKAASDFRPGTPLNEISVILKTPIDPKSPQTPLLEHYYSMTLSKCYRESGGKLGCQSCHDPHVQPTAAEARNYFRTRCLQCHTEKSCTLDVSQRRAQQDACTSCHMAKKPALTVSHSTLTEHRILRTPDEQYPAQAFVESLPGTGFIHVNAVPGAENQVSQVTLLKAYRKELMRGNLQFKDRYFGTLARLEKEGSGDPFVLSAIGQKAESDGDLAKAVKFARQALDPESASDSDYLQLAGVLAQTGDAAGSIGVLKKGIEKAPFSAVLYEDLARRQVEAGDDSEARSTIQAGLEKFPESSALRESDAEMTSQEHLQEAMARFQRGDIQGATTELRAAIAANENNAAAHDAMGIVLGESGQLEEATVEFRRAGELDPASAAPHFHLGLAFAKTDKTQDAIKEYQQALRLKPDMVEAEYGLSEICGKLGDYNGAIELLRAVTRAEPDFGEAHFNLGLNVWNRYKVSEGLRQRSELDEAAQELGRAAQLDPQQGRAFLAWGEVLSERGDFPTAVEKLKKAVELEPSNAEYHYNLGLAFRQSGNLPAAAEQLRISLQIAPQLAMAHRSLGLVLRESGDLAGAAAELHQAVLQLPDDAQGHHLLGTVLLKQGNLEAAIAELRKAVEFDPSLADARASLIQALQKSGRKEEAQKQTADLRQVNAASANAGQAMVLVQAAADQREKQDYAAAIKNLQDAISLDPGYSEARYQLALALQESGETVKAEDLFRKLVEKDPKHAQAHVKLGLALAADGKKAEARGELIKALEIAPSLAAAHTGLANMAKAEQDWPTVVNELQAAAAWLPHNREIHYQLAEALQAMGQTEESRREMQLAQQLGTSEGSAQ